MPGLDRKRIVGFSEQDLDQFTCDICLHIFVDPITAKCCGQTYCKDCIDNWMTLNSVCPKDGLPISDQSFGETPKYIQNILDDMKVKCDHHLDGCSTVIPFCKLKEHLINCQIRSDIVCKNCGHENNSNGSEHNCIRYLLNKNSDKNEENNRLEEEIKRKSRLIQSLIVENQNLMTNNAIEPHSRAIELARNGIGFHTILYQTPSIDSEWCQQIINKCKEAILLQNTYTTIAESIVDGLKKEKGLKKINWTAIVNIFQMIGLKSAHQYCLYIRFNSLAITVLGFK